MDNSTCAMKVGTRWSISIGIPLYRHTKWNEVPKCNGMQVSQLVGTFICNSNYDSPEPFI